MCFSPLKCCWHGCCYVVGVNINRKEANMDDQIVLETSEECTITLRHAYIGT